jgi:hypothetical protein
MATSPSRQVPTSSPMLQARSASTCNVSPDLDLRGPPTTNEPMATPATPAILRPTCSAEVCNRWTTPCVVHRLCTSAEEYRPAHDSFSGAKSRRTDMAPRLRVPRLNLVLGCLTPGMGWCARGLWRSVGQPRTRPRRRVPGQRPWPDSAERWTTLERRHKRERARPNTVSASP